MMDGNTIQNILKEKYPKSYREDIYPIIIQEELNLKDIKKLF